MFGSMFGNRDVKETAAIIVEICHMGRQANTTIGPNGALGVFKRHPFLKEHLPPVSFVDPHRFYFRDQLEPFEFWVREDEDMITVFGNDYYAGVLIVTPTKQGGYQVSVSPPLRQKVGRKAKALANVLVDEYGAMDTS